MTENRRKFLSKDSTEKRFVFINPLINQNSRAFLCILQDKSVLTGLLYSTASVYSTKFVKIACFRKKIAKKVFPRKPTLSGVGHWLSEKGVGYCQRRV